MASNRKAGNAPAARGKRVQLHRAISKLGWASRSVAWDWIRAGAVRVDGVVHTDPLTWIDIGRQKVTCDHAPQAPAVSMTIALHKPRGFVTTRKDERGRSTVYDLLPKSLPWLFPVGRLDADSEGLLILTNDSELAMKLTDPSHAIPKTYHVHMRGIPTADVLKKLRDGVPLHDGKTRPARVRIHQRDAEVCILEITLLEGRNRQIRRMLAAVGHRVRRLVRVAIGDFPLGELAPGTHQPLRPGDTRRLTAGSKNNPKPASRPARRRPSCRP